MPPSSVAATTSDHIWPEGAAELRNGLGEAFVPYGDAGPDDVDDRAALSDRPGSFDQVFQQSAGLRPERDDGAGTVTQLRPRSIKGEAAEAADACPLAALLHFPAPVE